MIRVCSENNLSWLEITINGKSHGRINTLSIKHAKEMKLELEKLITSVYKQAYNDGFDSVIACFPQ